MQPSTGKNTQEDTVEKLVTLSAAALAVIALSLLHACSEQASTENRTLAATVDTPDVYPLAMGATNVVVGEVLVWNDTDTLYVRFVTYPGYELSDAHVCAELAPFPWQPPGSCPYTQDPMPPDATEWTFEIPLADLGTELCEQLIFIQAHASINDAETDSHVGSAYGQAFKGHLAYFVTCLPEEPPSEGCTLTQGYWKTHRGAWPVGSLTIGGVVYGKTELISILKTPPRGGDASLILAHQLIAAMLNVENGASMPLDVLDAFAAADRWMADNADIDGRLPFGTLANTADDLPNPEAWDEAVNLAAALDAYNNGNAGPPHCD